jgi:5-methylcytosine-specific restriction endonuclease McrA
MPVTVGKLGIVRRTGAELTALRRACFERDEYRCVVCGFRVRWESGYWESGHMAHKIGRGRGGSDVLENVQTKCSGHHWEEHNPKAVPKKEKT